MPIRGAHGLIGKQVVDAEGVELGYVSSEDDRFLTIAEGPVGHLRLGRRYVADAAEKIVLRGPSRDLFEGLNVIDGAGDFVGIVRDTMEAEDVLDSLIVEDEGGMMLNVLLENIRAIDEWVELDIGSDQLYEQQAAG
jgi:sporulation protein YlmC with PRC-barrel domain